MKYQKDRLELAVIVSIVLHLLLIGLLILGSLFTNMIQPAAGGSGGDSESIEAVMVDTGQVSAEYGRLQAQKNEPKPEVVPEKEVEETPTVKEQQQEEQEKALAIERQKQEEQQKREEQRKLELAKQEKIKQEQLKKQQEEAAQKKRPRQRALVPKLKPNDLRH